MMETFRQWAFSLCAAAMVCALIELLLPGVSLSKMIRLALSVFFLCVLLQPIGLEVTRGEVPGLAYHNMEQAEEYASQISGRIGEELCGSVEQQIGETLRKLGLLPGEYQTEIRFTEGQALVTVLLAENCAADPESVIQALEEDPLIRAEVIKEES